MFRDCKNEKEIKLLFRKFAQVCHPDKGGNEEVMRILTEAKDRSLKDLEDYNQNIKGEEKPYENFEDDKVFSGEIFEKLYVLKKWCTLSDIKFIKSVAGYFDTNRFMSSSQYKTLDKIYHRSQVRKEHG